MSGDQRPAAVSVPGHSAPDRRRHTVGRLVTREYRRARLSVVLALLLLAGTAVYLVAQERQQTWASARASVFNLTRISGDLSQSPAGPPEPGRAIAVLRNAAS